MEKIAYFVLSTAVLFAGAGLCYAQGPAVDPAIRERERQRQRAYEDPRNNPFKHEDSPPLKKKGALEPASPSRAIVELRVVGITDGDTLIITNTAYQHMRIRLQGIDAPERDQSFGNTAGESLTSLVLGKSVSIEFDPRGTPDKEGRIVAKVYLEGRDVGLEQIRSGLAWYCKDYKKVLSESDRYVYAEAEQEARLARKGLWRESSPKEPWKFRKAK